jgi:hypothetical protein
MVFSHGGISVTKGHWEAAQDGACCSVTANILVDFLTCQFPSTWNKWDVQIQPQLQGPIIPNWLLVTISPRVILCKVKHQGKGITEIRACVRQQLSTAPISVKPLSTCFTECKDWTCILFFHFSVKLNAHRSATFHSWKARWDFSTLCKVLSRYTREIRGGLLHCCQWVQILCFEHSSSYTTSFCLPSAKLEHNPRNFQLMHLLVSRQNFVKL